MFRIFFVAVLILLRGNFLFAQISICTWNLQNFGKSKSDSQIVYIANQLRDFDVAGIVEVVAGNGGAQAVARLADELNRKGSAWDYTISDPTTGNPYQSERYAFLWKTSKLKKLGKAQLETQYKNEIEREPYMITFEHRGKLFNVALLHAVPKKKQPEREIKYLKFIEERYPEKNILFMGDFNCPQSHTVFNPLKERGYHPALVNTRTTIKMKPAGAECLASEYDNIFFHPSAISKKNSGTLKFYKDFPTLVAARKLSDHLPVWMEFGLN